jgi:hypothetical protein
MKISELSQYILDNISDYDPFSYSEASEICEYFVNDAILYDKDLETTDDINISNLEDQIHEYADGLVDIYYSDIYASASKFSDSVEDARDEGLLAGDESLDKQIQVGQYKAYYSLLSQVVDLIRDL